MEGGDLVPPSCGNTQLRISFRESSFHMCSLCVTGFEETFTWVFYREELGIFKGKKAVLFVWIVTCLLMLMFVLLFALIATTC